MYVPYIFISLHLTCVVSTVFSLSANNTPAATSSSKIGSTACFVYGDYDKISDCELDAILCDQLPHECSSYVWIGASVNLAFSVFSSDYPIDTGYFGKLTKCSKIPIILAYGYNTFQQWSLALACCAAGGMNVRDEVKGLKTYLSKYDNIAGLMLRNLDIIPETPSYKDFSKNLKCYIEELRKNLPGLEIGIYLYADELTYYYTDPVQEWIDFKDLCTVLDFVVLSYAYFNEYCAPELKNIGVAPITGDFKFTMEETQQYIHKAGIPKEKLLCRIELQPIPFGYALIANYSHCKINTKTMCKDPKGSADWCAPSTQLLYDKGVFTKKNAMGIAAAHVDLDDLYCDCKCGRSFPLFRALLDGFNGAPRPLPCDLLDRC